LVGNEGQYPQVYVGQAQVIATVGVVEAHFLHVNVQVPFSVTVNVSCAVVIVVGTESQYFVNTTAVSTVGVALHVRTVVQALVTVKIWPYDAMVVGTVSQVAVNVLA